MAQQEKGQTLAQLLARFLPKRSAPPRVSTYNEAKNASRKERLTHAA